MKCLVPSLRLLLLVSLGVACLAGVFLFSSWCFSSSGPASGLALADKAKLEDDLTQLKDKSIDPDKPLRIQVDVDYSASTKASWYPKQESPILTPLVQSGNLPPVAERHRSLLKNDMWDDA